jgi:hypothetical protein
MVRTILDIYPVLQGNGEQIAALFDRPVAFHRPFVKVAGGVTGALMLSQAVYWSGRTRNSERWFYKSAKEWEEETGLTRREQETARKRLAHVLQTKLRGVPATVHYRVDFDALCFALRDYAKERETSMAENAKLDATNPPNWIGGKRQTITETTQETTSHIAEPPVRDECVLALASLENPDLSQITDWGKHTKACARIKERCPALSPDIIRERAANYRTHFSVSITSTGLAKHWAMCEAPHAKPAAPKPPPPKMTLRQKPPSVSVEEYNTEWAARIVWLEHCRKNGLDPEK